jgi:hypothetical protein
MEDMVLAAVLALAIAAGDKPPPYNAVAAGDKPPPYAAPAATAGATGTAAGAEIVEEVVAVVRNPPSAPPRVVTRTKLVEEARIALVSRGATAAATGPLDRAALRAALDWLVDQMLLADEAAKLRLDEVNREEVLSELRRFQERFPSLPEYEAFLARSELSEDELVATLTRMVRVQRYVQSRIGRAARVGDDEVDRWLRERGAAAVPTAARDVARAQIAEERAGVQVRELLSELRARADIRVIGSLRGGEGA